MEKVYYVRFFVLKKERQYLILYKKYNFFYERFKMVTCLCVCVCVCVREREREERERREEREERERERELILFLL